MRNNAKEEKLNIRVTSKEKKKISKCAEYNDMTVSDYVRTILFPQDSKTGNTSIAMTTLLVEMQEIVNYIDEEYGADDKLERMMNKLWKIN